MNSEDAAALLPLHRPGREASGPLKKAIACAEKDPALAVQFADQCEFDQKMVGVLNSIAPPENLRAKLREASGRPDGEPPKARSNAFHPAVLTAILGVLLIIGFLVWTVMERMERFAGREAMERMLVSTSKMSGVELDPVATNAGAMQDWFYMRGFEGFALPPELAALPAVGSRVYRTEGHPIAQIAVDRNASIVFVFRASDFGVELPADQPWHLLEHEGWAAAIQRRGDICSMLAFRGKKAEMQEFLATLQKP